MDKKFAEYVQYQRLVEDINLADKLRRHTDILNDLWRTVADTPWGSKETDLDLMYQCLAPSMNRILDRAKELHSQLRKKISMFEIEYHDLSEIVYLSCLRDNNQYVLERTIPLKHEVAEELTNRIRTLSSWQYPGLFIRPSTRKLIEEMSSSDPLFIADQNLELLEPALSKFTDVYQKRIRCITVNDDADTKIAGAPINQFGSIICLDFFEYKPQRLIEQYLVEFYQLLRDGGGLIFSFNNCDHEHGVRLVDNSFRTYTTLRALKSVCQQIGYKVLKHQDIENSLSWLEVKKPGKLDSIRGGQSLARIIMKPE